MSRSRFTVSALVALGLFAATGCVEERAFYILQNQLPVVQDGVCSSSGAEGTFLPEGVLDVSAGQGYFMYPLLKFDIVSSKDDVEKNNFSLREFRIGLDMSEIPEGAFTDEETSFSRPSSGTLRPASTTGTVVKVIPDSLAAKLKSLPADQRPTVVVHLQAIAVRLGTDSEIESTTFEYPVTLCNKCLVYGGKIDPCPSTEESVSVVTNDCGIPQDSTVYCCTVDGATHCLSKQDLKGGSN